MFYCLLLLALSVCSGRGQYGNNVPQRDDQSTGNAVWIRQAECGTSEIFYTCRPCDRICGSNNQLCPIAQCQEGCGCPAETLRDINGICVQFSECFDAISTRAPVQITTLRTEPPTTTTTTTTTTPTPTTTTTTTTTARPTTTTTQQTRPTTRGFTWPPTPRPGTVWGTRITRFFTFKTNPTTVRSPNPFPTSPPSTTREPTNWSFPTLPPIPPIDWNNLDQYSNFNEINVNTNGDAMPPAFKPPAHQPTIIRTWKRVWSNPGTPPPVDFVRTGPTPPPREIIRTTASDDMLQQMPIGGMDAWEQQSSGYRHRL